MQEPTSSKPCEALAQPTVVMQAGALVVVDNSIMAPVFQQPLALGADVSMTSATKFIGGHSDITGGTLSIRGKELAQRLYFVQARRSVPCQRRTAILSHTLCSCSPHAHIPESRACDLLNQFVGCHHPRGRLP